MKALIWIVVSIFIPELVHGVSPTPIESNPYKEALLAHPWESVQSYAEVRPGVQMFYWLYYADGTSVGAASKPLIIFIQSGGLAASGIANFAEIGPLTMDMEPRNHTWVKGRNVLLIDDPVGTGFSIANTEAQFATTDEEIVNDLYVTIEWFLSKNNGFRPTPTYIVGQGYGGKICPSLAYRLHTAINEKRLAMNLKGIGIGSGFVDMKESICVYPDFLYTVGLIDRNTYLETTRIVKRVGISIELESYRTGLKWVSSVLIANLTEESNMTINPYNIQQSNPFPALDELKTKINNYVKPTLSPESVQKVDWQYVSNRVYEMLNETFLVSSVNNLEKLLNGTELKVVIYNGNLDAIAPISGASNWAHDLKWHGSKEFYNAKRNSIKGTNNGFYKEAKHLSFWWVFEAGHWVPEDNPEAMEHILEYLVSDNNNKKTSLFD